MRGGRLLDAFREAAGGATENFFVTGSSASAPATSRRWPRSTSATTGPLEAAEAGVAIPQIKAARVGSAVLPPEALAKRPLPGGPDG
jgi:hypothetical protein